jgi:GntR family transcriptional regulator, transcriptional repressor for pyruvate dehydrogenase complex
MTHGETIDSDGPDFSAQLRLLRTREPVPTEIAKGLIADLLSGASLPGDRLPSERELSSAIGVARSVVRDALRLLTLLGIIEVRQGNGSYYRATESELLPKVVEWGLLLGQRSTDEFIEARCCVEIALASLAAERRTEEDLLDLRSLLRKMEAASTTQDFIDADTAFHLRLAETAGNSVLAGILLSIRSLIQVWITRVTESAEFNVQSYEEHVRILAAIEEQDESRAATAMEAHLKSAAAKLIRVLEA